MTVATTKPASIELRGMPISLNVYNGAGTITNKYFTSFEMPEFEKIYLPDSLKPFTNMDPIGTKELLIDDNRSAVSRQPYITIDGTDFYFSVKGIGSTTSPFSRQLFKKEEICSLLKNNGIRDRIMNAKEKEKFPRFVTGELWSRGCPYGSQGLEFASIAMRATEMSDASTTSSCPRLSKRRSLRCIGIGDSNKRWFRKRGLSRPMLGSISTRIGLLGMIRGSFLISSV